MLSKLFIVTLFASSLAFADKPKGRRSRLAPPSLAVQQAPVPGIDVAAIRQAADYLACVQAQARYVEAASGRRAQCEAAATRVRDCIGRVRDRQSSNTGKGAIIGLAAAVATGGASLLFTGVGALVGHQTSDEAPQECGVVPVCDVATIEMQLASEGIRQRRCAQ